MEKKRFIKLDLEPSDDLLPCPFCGDYEMEMDCELGQAHYFIICQCDAFVRGYDASNNYELSEIEKHEKSKASAISRWNKRVDE